MTELLKRFENLTLSSSEEERNSMQGYVCKVKSEKKYFACENNFFVIPDRTGSKFVLCERKYHGPDNYIVSHGCRNLVSFENIK